jgi:hypothetical protein
MECGRPFTGCDKCGCGVGDSCGGIFVKDGYPFASNVGDCGAVLYIKQSSKLAPGACGAVTAIKLIGIINMVWALSSKNGLESLLHMIYCMSIDMYLNIRLLHVL